MGGPPNEVRLMVPRRRAADCASRSRRTASCQLYNSIGQIWQLYSPDTTWQQRPVWLR
jgi:hypothetical protein